MAPQIFEQYDHSGVLKKSKKIEFRLRVKNKGESSCSLAWFLYISDPVRLRWQVYPDTCVELLSPEVWMQWGGVQACKAPWAPTQGGRAPARGGLH